MGSPPRYSGYISGHKAYCWGNYVGEPRNPWRYEDTDEIVPDVPTRPCPRCKLPPTAEGHDPCIANLPGVRFACCGHGVAGERGYIMFEDGRVIRFDAKNFITPEKENS